MVLIEKTRSAGEVIEANIAAVALPGTLLLVGDVSSVLGRLGGQVFDLILVDPPYEVAAAEIASILMKLQVSGLAAGGAGGGRATHPRLGYPNTCHLGGSAAAPAR